MRCMHRDEARGIKRCSRGHVHPGDGGGECGLLLLLRVARVTHLRGARRGVERASSALRNRVAANFLGAGRSRASKATSTSSQSYPKSSSCSTLSQCNCSHVGRQDVSRYCAQRRGHGHFGLRAPGRRVNHQRARGRTRRIECTCGIADAARPDEPPRQLLPPKPLPRRPRRLPA